MDNFRIKHGPHLVFCDREQTAERVAIALSIEDRGKSVLIETDRYSERLGLGRGVFRPWARVTGGHAVETTSTVRLEV